MTPLQHAAFRGQVEIAELLLSHGADVNSNYHENDYSALMFAALSGRFFILFPLYMKVNRVLNYVMYIKL